MNFNPRAYGETICLLYIGRRQQVAKTLRSALLADKNIEGKDAAGDDAADDDAAGDDAASTAKARDHLRITFSTVTNQKAALEFTRSKTPDVLLIEVNDGAESRKRFCEMMRYRLPQAIILAVSRFEVKRSVQFDGFIHLPLLPSDAIKAINTSMDKLVNHQLDRGHIQLNTAQRTVITPAGESHMTPKQCALLDMLMRHHNQVVKRADIMHEIWETEYMDDTRTLDVHIRWLRQLIEPNPSKPRYLLTIRRIGYRLCLE